MQSSLLSYFGEGAIASEADGRSAWTGGEGASHDLRKCALAVRASADEDCGDLLFAKGQSNVLSCPEISIHLTVGVGAIRWAECTNIEVFARQEPESRNRD